MIYLTGDCHGDFSRFTRRQRAVLPFILTEKDYVIVCGDFGLLWTKNRELKYNLDWLSRLPFTILWVQGNHENYNMIAEYPLEEWNGGKVRHIIRDKIILLERGQIFTIAGKTFFTFGGASSRDISGGILDRSSSAYHEEYKRVSKSTKPFRILNESWWSEELPNKDELEESTRNLSQAEYKVDYVISHCGSNRLQESIELYKRNNGYNDSYNNSCNNDILTDYFEELEDKLQYKKWFCGHYHKDIQIDEKHIVLYHDIIPIETEIVKTE